MKITHAIFSKKGLPLLIFLFFFLNSCGIKREYDTSQDCYNAVNGDYYGDIVKAWGEPDIKDDAYVGEPSLNEQEQGVKSKITITCTWKSPKVVIHNCPCIHIVFDVIEIGGGVMEPANAQGYIGECDCNNPVYGGNASQTNNYPTPVVTDTASKIDTSQKQESHVDTFKLNPVATNVAVPTNSPTPQNNANVTTNNNSNSKLNMIHLSDEMIKVDGGAFDMGSELNGQNASPVHTVQLHDFYMTKYLISVSQWELIMHNRIVNDNSPIVHVSWYDVQEFITELNSLTKKQYRLPTEAEWEYAARGGNQSKGYIYSGTSNSQEIHQAGRSNELGIVDMTGIDWQWCSDWGNAGFYKNGQIDPQDLSPSNMKIKRGGGWANRPENCTVTFRHALEPNRSDADISFRLVVDSNQ